MILIPFRSSLATAIVAVKEFLPETKSEPAQRVELWKCQPQVRVRCSCCAYQRSYCHLCLFCRFRQDSGDDSETVLSEFIIESTLSHLPRSTMRSPSMLPNLLVLVPLILDTLFDKFDRIFFTCEAGGRINGFGSP